MNLLLKFYYSVRKTKVQRKMKQDMNGPWKKTEKLNGPSMYDKMTNLTSNQKV